MLNLTKLIDWRKCFGERIPVVVQRKLQRCIHGIFWIPKSKVQALVDLNKAFCRGQERTLEIYVDCDNDALFCVCGIKQELLWDYCLPMESESQKYNWRASKRIFQKQDLWEDTYDGLLPVVIQEVASLDVLMLAWMNQEAWEESMQSQETCFFSRSKNRLWRKGEESGNRQVIQGIKVLVGGGIPHTLLFEVEQIGGAACHKGYKSCFYRRVSESGLEVVGERIFDPKQVYMKGE
ncbi:MAG: phosphoribosyl-AMP cyclohydrolase [Patescibacteria group bacterium]